MIALWLALLGCSDPTDRRDTPTTTAPTPGASTTTPAGTPSTTATLDCPPDVAIFDEHVWTPALEPTCLACHAPGGIGAEGSRLVLDPDDLRASLDATVVVVDNLLAKPTGTHPDGHGGGTVVAPGTAAHAALTFWVGWVNGDCAEPGFDCEDADAPRVLRRLTHAEYDRTLEDLLGLSGLSAGFASDPVVHGFRNDAHALVVPELLADQYRGVAEEAAFAVDIGALLPCDPAEVGEAACATLFAEDLGYRLFRRPLTADDVARYHALWEQVAVVDGFEAGVRWVLAAQLQSPHFLYRAELGVADGTGRFTLTGWELATALSYTLLGTTPDDALLARAAAGDLDTPDGLADVVAALSADPRVDESVADFVHAWLDLGQLATVSREGLTDDLRDAMAWETHDTVVALAPDGDLASLLRDGALLTQPAVLTTHGKASGSGPVQRGVLVRERLLCEELPPPPSDLDTSPPPVDPSASTRERYAAHSDDPACAGCHVKIDPLGFGFEHYDQLGRWRDDDGGHVIDDSGDVDGVPFVGPEGLSDVLLDDPRFRSCFVQTWRRHATGMEACGEDLGATVGLVDPLLEVPQRERFRVRGGGPDEGDTLAIGDRIVPDLPDEPELPPGGLTFDYSVVSDWGAGYCADGLVTNTGEDVVVWSVRAPIDGVISSLWNAELVDEDVDWVFEGVEWNAELGPGEAAAFGLCAER